MSDLSIKVKIVERTYPLTIKREEEEGIRRAASNVNEYVKTLKDNYGITDRTDLLSMTALHMSEKATNSTGELNIEASTAKLQAISDKLDAYINS
jgi:cell division protein ZapA (FtsZ GTPase activity inhibitor)